jgi:hypothetical protein
MRRNVATHLVQAYDPDAAHFAWLVHRHGLVIAAQGRAETKRSAETAGLTATQSMVPPTARGGARGGAAAEPEVRAAAEPQAAAGPELAAGAAMPPDAARTMAMSLAMSSDPAMQQMGAAMLDGLAQ